MPDPYFGILYILRVHENNFLIAPLNLYKFALQKTWHYRKDTISLSPKSMPPYVEEILTATVFKYNRA